MDFYELENMQKTREWLYTKQRGRCAGCGKLFKPGEKQELAHKIAQHKWVIKKYGKNVIHHKFNLALTHPGACNDAVMVSPEKHKARMILEKIWDEIGIGG